MPLIPDSATRFWREDTWGLLEQRTVLLFGPLDQAAGTRAAAQIMTLDAEGGDEIRVHLSCEEAELLSALMLAETMELARSPVVVVAKGVVAGAALAVMAAADRRVASSRTIFRMCEPQHSLSGVAREISVGAEELCRQVDRLHAWVAAAAGQPQQTVAEDMRQGRILDAAAAVGYGLINAILEPPDKQDR